MFINQHRIPFNDDPLALWSDFGTKFLSRLCTTVYTPLTRSRDLRDFSISVTQMFANLVIRRDVTEYFLPWKRSKKRSLITFGEISLTRCGATSSGSPYIVQSANIQRFVASEDAHIPRSYLGIRASIFVYVFSCRWKGDWQSRERNRERPVKTVWGLFRIRDQRWIQRMIDFSLWNSVVDCNGVFLFRLDK